MCIFNLLIFPKTDISLSITDTVVRIEIAEASFSAVISIAAYYEYFLTHHQFSINKTWILQNGVSNLNYV